MSERHLDFVNNFYGPSVCLLLILTEIGSRTSQSVVERREKKIQEEGLSL